jgi:hypothetical protein|tara:strand:- start:17 stop:250 length:234 start_codon:yes stop_codon:yes gene_type:complete
MKWEFEEGDLVYLPQDATIVRPDPEYGYPATVLKIDKPTAAVFLGETEQDEYNILFKGERWCALPSQVYPMDVQNAN